MIVGGDLIGISDLWQRGRIRTLSIGVGSRARIGFDLSPQRIGASYLHACVGSTPDSPFRPDHFAEAFLGGGFELRFESRSFFWLFQAFVVCYQILARGTDVAGGRAGLLDQVVVASPAFYLCFLVTLLAQQGSAEFDVGFSGVDVVRPQRSAVKRRIASRNIRSARG